MGTGIETGSAPDSSYSFPEFFSGGTNGTAQSGSNGNAQTTTQQPAQTPSYQPQGYPPQPQYIPAPNTQPQGYPQNYPAQGYPNNQQPVNQPRQPQGYPQSYPAQQPQQPNFNNGYQQPNAQKQEAEDPIEIARNAGRAGYLEEQLNSRAMKLGYSSLDALTNTIEERYEWDRRTGNAEGQNVYNALVQMFKVGDYDRAEALVTQYYGHGYGYRPQNQQSQNFIGLNPGQSLNFQQNQSGKPYSDERAYDRARWYGTQKEQEAAIAAMEAYSKKGELPY